MLKKHQKLDKLLMINSVCFYKKLKFFFNYWEKIGTFSNYLLPEYEKNCLTEYLNQNEDKLIFLNKMEDKMKTVYLSMVLYYFLMKLIMFI